MRGHYVGHMNMHNKVKAFKCLHCPRPLLTGPVFGGTYETVTVANSLSEGIGHLAYTVSCVTDGQILK